VTAGTLPVGTLGEAADWAAEVPLLPKLLDPAPAAFPSAANNAKRQPRTDAIDRFNLAAISRLVVHATISLLPPPEQLASAGPTRREAVGLLVRRCCAVLRSVLDGVIHCGSAEITLDIVSRRLLLMTAGAFLVGRLTRLASRAHCPTLRSCARSQPRSPRLWSPWCLRRAVQGPPRPRSTAQVRDRGLHSDLGEFHI
jgi:hypothetical protein